MTDSKLQTEILKILNSMEKIIEKELSYKLGGIFFEVQDELGRFARERQYADLLEKKLSDAGIAFKRELSIEIAGRKSNFVDFIIEERILIDLKAKPFIKKDDYYQMKRYLQSANKELGIIVNFRDEYLKPKRVLNGKFVDSDKKFVGSHRSGGQVMVEAIIAVTIAVVGLLGIFSLTSRSLSLNKVVASQYIGSNLAAEGIELVKNLIDRNVIQNVIQGRSWNDGLTSGEWEMDYNDTILETYNDQPILLDNSSGYYSYDAGDPTDYRRKIIIEEPRSDEIKVVSLVSWTTRGGGQFSVNAEDHFFNWR